jgi:hypothetical protein
MLRHIWGPNIRAEPSGYGGGRAIHLYCTLNPPKLRPKSHVRSVTPLQGVLLCKGGLPSLIHSCRQWGVGPCRKGKLYSALRWRSSPLPPLQFHVRHHSKNFKCALFAVSSNYYTMMLVFSPQVAL